MDASNGTFQVRLGDELAVYKPIAGEAPLPDFPSETLAIREVAAYEIARAGGWQVIPETVLREGPLGPGSVQRWIGAAGGQPPDQFLSVLAPDQVPEQWLPVLMATDEAGQEVVVAHLDHPDLRSLALLDLVLNNADRKGTHLLADGAQVRGIDHGLCLHQEPKVRSVLWGFAGQPFSADDLAGLQRLAGQWDTIADGALGLLSDGERDALHARVDALIETARYPAAPTDRYPLPWPLW